MKTAILLLLAALSLRAQEAIQLTQWKISIAGLAAASAADAVSSWHQPEANPILASNGQFGTKALALKSSVTAGMVLAEVRLVRRHPPLRKWFTIANWAAAGLFSGAAVHNWRER